MRHATLALLCLAAFAPVAARAESKSDAKRVESAAKTATGDAKPSTRSEGPSPPAAHDRSQVYDLIDHSVVRPLTRVADLALLVRKVTDQPREAVNVDQDDEVRLPSTWWQPRIGLRRVSVAQMLAGPHAAGGPPAPGKWRVTKAKLDGRTPGFQIEDATGGRFVIKFDPPGSPELSTGCEVIGTHLFWAAGYNVPDNSLATFRFEDLEIGKGATYVDPHGRKRPMTADYLRRLLAGVHRRPDGSYRCLASRYLKGTPLGPFEYRGRRGDDPEDLIPHEHRRELRGLWALCAWTNHADSRGQNTLDMWVKDGGRTFVRHHLIDFSAILGAGPFGPRSAVAGTQYYVDYGVMAEQLATLGAKSFAWEASEDPGIPAVGWVDAATFDPAGWRPDYPNPAFDERTTRDVRWGARIVAGFTDAHIRAAVRAADYSDPRANEYISRVLIERRDKLTRRWLAPQADETESGGMRVRTVDHGRPPSRGME